MKRIDLPLISDVLFYGACAWFFSVGILRYKRVPLALAAVLALLFACAAAGIVFLLLYYLHRKRYLSKHEQEERDALLLHLALEKEEKVRAALLTALTRDGTPVHCLNDILSSESTLYLPRFTMQPLSADEIARLIRTYGKTDYVLLCNALSPEAEKLAHAFQVKIMRADQVYALFRRTEMMPDPLICAELPRRSAKHTFRRIFSKKSARPFLISGILLLIMSLFTFFPLYYLISGSIALFFAIIVRLFGYARET